MMIATNMLTAQQLHVFEEWAQDEGVQEFFYRNVTATDSDRSVYVAGATLNQNGDYDLLITKYNRDGDFLWKDTIAGPSGGHDFATDLVIDGEGNVVVCGSISQGGAQGQNMLVVKYDPDGFEYWRYSHDYDNGNDAAASVCVNSSNRIFVTGATQAPAGYADMLTIHLNFDGSFIWEKAYDYNELHDIGVKILPSGSDVIVTGIGQQTTTNWRVMALNYAQSDGGLNGMSSSGSGTVAFEEVRDMVIDDSGNIYLVGSTLSLTNGMDVMLIKLDDELNIEWTQTWDGSGQADHGYGVRVAPNGDVYVCGSTRTTTQGDDALLLKYNASGNLVWSQTYNGSHNGDDTAESMEWHPDGYLYLTGSSYVVSNSDYLTLKYDTDGALLWEITYNSPFNKNDRATNMAIDDDGDIIVSGQCEINDSTTTYYTVKYVERDIINPYSTLTSISSKYLKPNKGQLTTTDHSAAFDVLFINDCDYPRSYVLSDRISYVFRNSDESVYQFLLDGYSDTTISINAIDTLVRVDMKPKNTIESRKIVPFNQKRYYESYFLSHFDDRRIHSYEQVLVLGLWRDIDMSITNEEAGMGFSLICKPQFKPEDIAWSYEGADSIEIVTPHSIIVHTQTGKFGYEADYAREALTNGTYNQLSWKPEFSMSGNYVVLGLGSYDILKPLILSLSKSGSSVASSSSNGNLEWSTYYGGSDSERFNVVATDAMGNAFVGGETQSDNFPVTPGVVQFEYELNMDACIVKFNHETLNNEWATFYGGTGVDRINGLAITSDDEIIMCGFTNSSDFPVENELQPYVGSSGFVGKLNSAGAIREWATPFGPFSFNTFTSVAVDNENNIYCVGYWIGQINGLNIQIYPQADTDSYANKAGNILKLSSSGNPLWSTTFGHRAYCRITDIAIDQNNNKYITGATRFEPENPEHTEPTLGINPNFVSNAQSDFGDGFIAKFGDDDNLVWSSWYCGSDLDQGESIAVNNDGSKICIVGATTSASGLPLLNALPNNSSYGGDDGQTPIGSTDHHGDGFIAEFSENGTFLFGSYLGGSNNDACLSVAYDWADQIYITGYTLSTNVQWLTNTSGGISGLFSQSSNQGLADGFIVALNPSRSLIWGSFFGGTSFDYGYGLATTFTDKLFLAGRTFSSGTNQTSPFPLFDPMGGAYFTDLLNLSGDGIGEKSDAFVSRFSLSPLTAVVSVEELDDSASLLIYPNPNSGQFYVDTESFSSSGPILVSIYSYDGRHISQFQLPENSRTPINTPNLPSGVYILCVEYEGRVLSSKFVKL